MREDLDIRVMGRAELEVLAEDDRNDMVLLRGLLAHAGWPKFVELVEHNAHHAQVANGGRVLPTLDDALEHNRQVGVVQGLQRSLSLPEAFTEALASRIDLINARIKELDDAATQDPPPDGGTERGDPDSEFDTFTNSGGDAGLSP
jgi:hypothetical protein